MSATDIAQKQSEVLRPDPAITMLDTQPMPAPGAPNGVYLGGDPMLDTQPMPMPAPAPASDPRAGARPLAYDAPIGPTIPEAGTTLDLGGIDPLDPSPAPTPTAPTSTPPPKEGGVPWVPITVGLSIFAILRALA